MPTTSVEHFEIEVGSKPLASTTNVPYEHCAKIVLPNWCTIEQAERQYELWCTYLHSPMREALYKCELYAVRVSGTKTLVR